MNYRVAQKGDSSRGSWDSTGKEKDMKKGSITKGEKKSS